MKLGSMQPADDAGVDSGRESERVWVAARLAEWRHLEALGSVAGGLAHDLNNQVTMIAHSVELAEMLDDPARYREACRQVQELCDQARRTIQRIQAFSRQATGRRQIVDFGELTQATIRLLRASLPPQVDLRGEIQPAGLPVLANANQVQEILIHLVDAAAAEMPAGGGMIRLSLSEARGEVDGPRGGRIWRLRVVGARAEPALWREIGTGGSGAKGELAERVTSLLRAHGALAWREEDGAGLRVSWPGVENGETGGASCSADGTTARAGSGGVFSSKPMLAHAYAGWHVAVVEDELTELAMLSEVLRSRGARVSGFSAAEDFLRWLGAGPAPDVLIVDQVLDRHGGEVLAKQFEQVSPGAPVLMIGASLEAGGGGGVEKPEHRRVLVKPFGFEALFEELDGLRGGLRKR